MGFREVHGVGRRADGVGFGFLRNPSPNRVHGEGLGFRVYCVGQKITV